MKIRQEYFIEVYGAYGRSFNTRPITGESLTIQLRKTEEMPFLSTIAIWKIYPKNKEA